MPRHEFPSMPQTGDSCASLNESNFRCQIRDLLDLPWDTRNGQVFDAIRRLKKELAETKAALAAVQIGFPSIPRRCPHCGSTDTHEIHNSELYEYSDYCRACNTGFQR